MTYEVQVARSAVRQLRTLDMPARRRVQAVVELLREEPRPPNARTLVGSSQTWRVRTGDLRVLYEIHDRRLVVLVVAVGHRREVYQQ
jgi:mRNA interferase RelE/StbE